MVGNWRIISGPVWDSDSNKSTVKAECLGCSVIYERITAQFYSKRAKHSGCAGCVQRRQRGAVYIDDGKKICGKCSEPKHLDEFHNDKTRWDGKFAWCKRCSNEHTGKIKAALQKNRDPHYLAVRRRSRDRENYGDATIFHTLIDSQGGKCIICKRDYDPRAVPRFAIDHCHKTHVIRGVLCGRCNNGLGCANDDIEILEGMIAYLRNNVCIPIKSGKHASKQSSTF